MNALYAELLKLRRPGILFGMLGTIVGSTVLIVVLVFSAATEEAFVPPGAQSDQDVLPPISWLEEAEGMVLAFQMAGILIGTCAMVLFAQSIGSEYVYGTLKVLLTHEPRRLILLAHKGLALSFFMLGAVLVSWVIQTLTAWTMAQARGFDTSDWWTAAGWNEAFATTIRVFAVSIAFGVIGILLGVGFRAAAPAIGVGIGYVLIFEQFLVLAWHEGVKWLPGMAINALAQGGNSELSLMAASWLTLAYSTAFAVAAGIIFMRRDVA